MKTTTCTKKTHTLRKLFVDECLVISFKSRKKCFSHITNLHTDMHQSVQTVNMDNILSIISFEEDIWVFFFLKFSIFLILSLNWRSWKGEKTYWHLKKYKSFFFTWIYQYHSLLSYNRFTPPSKSNIYDTISLLR